jgi:hypothetical protein
MEGTSMDHATTNRTGSMGLLLLANRVDDKTDVLADMRSDLLSLTGTSLPAMMRSP